MSLLYSLYRFKYRYSRSLPLRKPVDVSLELSSACNMACDYCYHADPKRLPFKRGFMEYNVAKEILVQSAKLGVNSVKLNWKGESTLNPWFAQIAMLARSLAKGSTFIDRLTNSNFKFNPDNELIFEGLAAQTKVKVSFDSFRKDVFEKQRFKGDHDLTMRNIDRFYHWRRNNELVIQAVRTSLNKDEDIEGQVRKRWPSATISIRDVVDGRKEDSIGDLANKERDTSERQACLQAFSRLIFNHEGVAFPCCPDIKETIMLGRIDRQSVRQIWNGFRAKMLRADLKDGTAFTARPTCKYCSSFETYKGYKPAWNS